MEYEKKLTRTFEEVRASKKDYKCKLCGAVNHRKEWNDVAEDYFGDTMSVKEIVDIYNLVGDAGYVAICPNCLQEVNATQIEKVE